MLHALTTWYLFSLSLNVVASCALEVFPQKIFMLHHKQDGTFVLRQSGKRKVMHFIEMKMSKITF